MLAAGPAQSSYITLMKNSISKSHSRYRCARLEMMVALYATDRESITLACLHVTVILGVLSEISLGDEFNNSKKKLYACSYT